MDGLSLYKVVRYLNGIKEPILNKVITSGNLIYFILFHSGKIIYLCFDTNEGDLFFVGDRPDGKDIFSKINNSKIVYIKQRGYDRLFYFKLAKNRHSGNIDYFKVVFEVVGGNSNLFILDGDNRILYTFSDRNIDLNRVLKIGNKYTAYKANKSQSIDNLDKIDFKSFSFVEGFYKKTADYLDNIYKMNNFDLNKTLDLAKKYLMDDFLYLDEYGKPYPFPIYDNMDKVHVSSYSGCKNIKKSDNISRYNRLISDKIRKKTELLEKLKLEICEAKKFNSYYEKADIIKNNLHRIDEALENGIFYKYTDFGVEEVSLQINNVDDIDNYIKKLYNLSKKLERSIPVLENRLKQVEGELLFLNDLKFYLENQALSEKEIRGALFKNVDQKMSQPAKRVKRYFVYKKGNTTIYVGKNSIGNDEILKISSPEDLWFHVKNLPSSHVILKMDSFFDQNLLVNVGQITAFFSKFSSEEKVLVDYTQRKFVKRVKGTPSGFVIYDNYKTLVVRPASPESLNFNQVDI